MYDAEITYHKGSDREITYDSSFESLEEAVCFIEHHAAGHMSVNAWINNKSVKVKNGLVMDSQGNRLSNNEAWHNIFAPECDRIPEEWKIMAGDTIERIFTKRIRP